MYKCVVFDLDGTLLDTIKDLAVAGNYALLKNNCITFEVEDYFNLVGKGIKILCKRALVNQNRYSDELLEKVYKDFKDYYSLHFSDFTKPFAGINEVLSSLKEKKIKYGIYSNKEEKIVKWLVKKHFNYDDFSFVLGESKDYLRKPDARQLLEKLEELHIDYKECIYVGDSEVDVETAINSKMALIGVSWGFRKNIIHTFENIDYLVDNPLDLIDIICKK